MKLATSRHGLPPDQFPFTIEASNATSGEIVWTYLVDGPGSVDIPPLAKTVGAPIKLRILWPDGAVTERGPS